MTHIDVTTRVSLDIFKHTRGFVLMVQIKE